MMIDLGLQLNSFQVAHFSMLPLYLAIILIYFSENASNEYDASVEFEKIEVKMEPFDGDVHLEDHSNDKAQYEYNWNEGDQNAEQNTDSSHDYSDIQDTVKREVVDDLDDNLLKGVTGL